MIERYALFVYFIIFVSVVFVWRTFKVWKATGIFPIAYGKSDNAHDFVGRIIKILILANGLVIIWHTFFNSFYMLIIPFSLLDIYQIKIIGWIILLFSLIFISYSQASMGKSWRIGVDEKTKTALVTSGIFRYSRNPIYLGILLTTIGIFFVLPTSINLALAIFTWFLLSVQIRLEEEFLIKVHEKKFEKYCQKVRRWI
jgi:protein-S-isoprenylcysteine O-methyltransferase Ste14